MFGRRRYRIALENTEPRPRSDYLAIEWDATRSAVIRSMIVGAAIAQLDGTDALDSIEPSFDALIDVPSDVDVVAGL